MEQETSKSDENASPKPSVTESKDVESSSEPPLTVVEDVTMTAEDEKMSTVEADTQDLKENTKSKPDKSSDNDSATKSPLDTPSSSCSGSGGDSRKDKVEGPLVAFKAIYNGKKYDMEMGLGCTIYDLKEALSPLIGVVPSMQKIMIKGLANNEKTLRELGVKKTSKVLVVGSKLDDIASVKGSSSPSSSKSTSSTIGKKERLCTQKLHKKIIAKGIPDDALPGIKTLNEALPRTPLSGMVNKAGQKVRLTFKLELDEIWIGSAVRTDKIPMTSVRSVLSEPIDDHEEYHIVGLGLGSTEASRYWVYWVPCQYVLAIKQIVLGGFYHQL